MPQPLTPEMVALQQRVRTLANHDLIPAKQRIDTLKELSRPAVNENPEVLRSMVRFMEKQITISGGRVE